MKTKKKKSGALKKTAKEKPALVRTCRKEKKIGIDRQKLKKASGGALPTGKKPKRMMKRAKAIKIRQQAVNRRKDEPSQEH
jgi:hypothetical protein